MYDVFISFKNLDKTGKPTRDSQIAREVYNELLGRGLRVFFSLVTLEKLGVSAYKAAIDKALDTSKVLVVVGTSAGNLETQWVRYEWDGFFNDILSGVKPDSRVFVYVEGCEPKILPRALRQSQIFDRNEGGLEKLANFIINALPTSTTAPYSELPKLVVASQPGVNLAAVVDGGSSLLEKRYGIDAVALSTPYPFLKSNWLVCDQERIYRLTGHRGPSNDKEVACRICGNRQEWDRYPSSELPRVCPDCGFEGDFSARVFVAFASEDTALANVVISELKQQQFRIKLSGVAKTQGGSLDIKRLREELSLCKACILIWTGHTANDSSVSAILSVMRDLDLPVLFLKVEQLDPQPRPDTERVLDFNGSAYWDAVLVGTLCDCLAVDEKRKREAHE